MLNARCPKIYSHYGNEFYKNVFAVKINSITFDFHLIRIFLYMYQWCSMKKNIKIMRTKLMSKYSSIATYDKIFLQKYGVDTENSLIIINT